MEAKLIVVSGKTNKKTVALKLPTVLGRGREADLTVAHPMVSRRHCELFEADGLLMIRDLGSLNGTFVAGRQISEAPLRPDDEFTIGPLTFRAVYEYRGDLDGVPAAETIEPEAAEAGRQASRPPAVDEVTPYDPFTVAPPAEEQGPDFAFLETAETPPPPEGFPDFSRWSQTETEPDVAEQTREHPVRGAEQWDEEEEEEPEPTPPPTLVRDQAAAEQPPAPSPPGKQADDEQLEDFLEGLQ